jgi:hypothetical protein
MVAYEAGRQAGASPSQNLPQSIPELQRQLTYLIISGAVIHFSRRGKIIYPNNTPN